MSENNSEKISAEKFSDEISAEEAAEKINSGEETEKKVVEESPEKSPEPSRKFSLVVKIITWIARILCGGLFIFSGFVKAIDPWGTFFKIEEYLNAFGFPLPFALLRLVVFALCAVEFVVGCFLLIGCFRKSCPVIACLIMAFMLPLTLWIAIENPVADCGCFGDALIISNWVTFWKNIVLTVGIVWLIHYNISAICLITPAFQWLAVVASGIFIVVIEILGFFVQPLIDFRDYNAGTELFSNMDADDDHGIDVFDKETLDDMNEEAENPGGRELVVMIPKVSMVSPATTWKLNSLYEWAKENDVKMIGVVSGSTEEIDEWEDLSMASYPVYLADDTAIKEVVRGNPGVVFLDDGKIVWKTTLSSMDMDDFEGPDAISPYAEYENDRQKLLINISVIYLIVMGGLVFISFTPRMVHMLTHVGLAVKRGVRHH